MRQYEPYSRRSNRLKYYCKHPRPFCLFLQRCEETKRNQQVKNKFNRVDLLKVQASIYNYDAMSLCETSLNRRLYFTPSSHPSGKNAVV